MSKRRTLFERDYADLHGEPPIIDVQPVRTRYGRASGVVPDLLQIRNPILRWFVALALLVFLIIAGIAAILTIVICGYGFVVAVKTFFETFA